MTTKQMKEISLCILIGLVIATAIYVITLGIFYNSELQDLSNKVDNPTYLSGGLGR